jgi:hypothetical protein
MKDMDWREYERRKRIISETARNAEEYQNMIRELVEEMGI